MKCGENSTFDCAGVALNIALPKAQDAISGLSKIGVLRPVHPHAPRLTSIWRGEPSGMSVPVISVELNHKPGFRIKGINAELTKQEFLSEVGDADFVEDGVARHLKLVRLSGGLINVHLDKARNMIWVRVSASNRTIRWCRVMLCGRRASERISTSFAYILILVSPLPLVGMFRRTEEVLRRIKPLAANVGAFAANLTRSLFASKSSWPFIRTVALQ